MITIMILILVIKILLISTLVHIMVTDREKERETEKYDVHERSSKLRREIAKANETKQMTGQCQTKLD